MDHKHAVFPQISTSAYRMMENAFVGSRGLQAITEGNKATGITAMMIQVNPGNLGVARFVRPDLMQYFFG